MSQLMSLVPGDQSHLVTGVGSSLAAATTLRAIMKNHPEIHRKVLGVLREQVAALGVVIGENAWDGLLVASADELEHSKAHVIE